MCGRGYHTRRLKGAFLLHRGHQPISPCCGKVNISHNPTDYLLDVVGRANGGYREKEGEVLGYVYNTTEEKMWSYEKCCSGTSF